MLRSDSEWYHALQSRKLATTLGKIKKLPVALRLGQTAFSNGPLQTLLPLFPKDPGGKWSFLDGRRDGPFHDKGTFYSWWYYWLLKEKSLWHTDRSSRFSLCYSCIYLISWWMCLWIIHFYKNNIIPLRSAYFFPVISAGKQLFTVFSF